MSNKIIAVFGATGNQGGSVAKLLLQYPNEYIVRAITRDPNSDAAKALHAKGAQVVQADLTVPASLAPAVKGCWGVFGVTNFYDAKIKDDPSSEEQQGKNLVDAAMAAGVECFIWSTLPSSNAISGGRFVSRIYEGKYHVDDYIREKNYPAVFLYTGNFFENMILRKHMRYDRETNTIHFHQPVINATTRLAMLYVEKDLSAIVKALLDQWPAKKQHLTHRYLHAASQPRLAPADILACVAATTTARVVAPYERLATSGWRDRDVMFELYNACGMYGEQEIPDPEVVEGLGVELHGIEDFVRERLAPYLGVGLRE